MSKNDSGKINVSLIHIDPANFTGAELHEILSKGFYPFVRLKDRLNLVSFQLAELYHVTDEANKAATDALNISIHYRGSNLERDLLQNHQKIKEILGFLENFEPFQVEGMQGDVPAKL